MLVSLPGIIIVIIILLVVVVKYILIKVMLSQRHCKAQYRIEVILMVITRFSAQFAVMLDFLSDS